MYRNRQYFIIFNLKPEQLIPAAPLKAVTVFWKNIVLIYILIVTY